MTLLSDGREAIKGERVVLIESYRTGGPRYNWRLGRVVATPRTGTITTYARTQGRIRVLLDGQRRPRTWSATFWRHE